MNARDAAERYAKFFTQLKPADLARFEQFFLPEAHFRDPFNDVDNVTDIRRVFAHMFTQCTAPRFTVDEIVVEGQVAYLHWTFDCQLGTSIDGLSRVLFAPDGRVSEHVDYWDPAAQLYEKLPMIGALMRWLRRRLSARG